MQGPPEHVESTQFLDEAEILSVVSSENRIREKPDKGFHEQCARVRRHPTCAHGDPPDISSTKALFYGLYVGASWLKKKQTTVTCASLTNEQMKRHAPPVLVFPSRWLTAEEGRNHSFQLQLTLVHALFSTFWNMHKNKEAHSRKEGTPSFRRRHKKFKLFKKNYYSSDQALHKPVHGD